MENVTDKRAVVSTLRELYPETWAYGLIRVSPPSPTAPENDSAGKRPIDKKWQIDARERYASHDGLEQHLDAIATHVCGGGNVGLAVPEGVVVLDADSEDDFEKLRDVIPVGTPLQRTRRGGHAVLRTTRVGRIKNRTALETDGMKVDVRAAGAMIVVAPSTHRGGTKYEWEHSLPQTIADLPPCPVALENAIADTAIGKRSKSKRSDLIHEGARNSTLASYAGRLRRTGLKAAEILEALQTLNNGRCRPPLAADEVERIALSIASYEPGDDVSIESARFEERDGSTIWLKPSRNGGFTRQLLANLTARIVREDIHDDGAEQRVFVAITGEIANGIPLPEITVSAEEFHAMTWLTRYPSTAIVQPGSGTRERLRCAIQSQSRNVVRRRIVAHLGWRDDDGVTAFYHAGGAVGADGIIPDVSVELPSTLERFTLPSPPTGEVLQAALRSVLRLLLIGPFKIMMPLLAAVFRSIIGGSDFTVHMVGRTGTFKTAVASLMQSHFGSGLDPEHLPASWLSTANSLERIAFIAKDVLLVVDDFAPAGSRVDQQRQNREAERLVRAQGNHAGRGRMNPDGTLQVARPPRGLVLSTGEEVPGSHSARARTVVVEISPGHINAARLSDAQRDAADGLFAAAMAGMIRWLAPRLPAERARAREISSAWRSRSFAHRRTPNALGQLAAGFDLLLRFAGESGVLDGDEIEDLQRRGESALLELGESQVGHHKATDPVDRFIALIVGALASGKAHIASANDPSRPPPQNPERYGWRRRAGYSATAWVFDAQGSLIGWRRGGHLFLEPEAAFEIAQGSARGQGESIPVGPRTLWKRLDERGLLVRHDKDHLTSKVMIGTNRQRVIHLRDSALFPAPISSNGAHCDESERGTNTPHRTVRRVARRLRLPDQRTDRGSAPDHEA